MNAYIKDSDNIVIFFILFFLIFFSYAVFTTATEIRENVEESKKESRHLPTECEQYYDNGTDEWKECMGVGYK